MNIATESRRFWLLTRYTGKVNGSPAGTRALCGIFLVPQKPDTTFAVLLCVVIGRFYFSIGLKKRS